MWGLHLSSRSSLKDYDLRGLETFRWESGFASLLGGLLLATEGGKPDTSVWASVAWRDGHFEDVRHLNAKLDLAKDFGVRAFFCKNRLAREVDQWVSANPQYQDLPRSFEPKGVLGIEASKDSGALQEYLREFGLEPDENEPFAVRCKYYQHIPNRLSRREYYTRRILDELALRCRRDIQADLTCRKVDWLVTFVSRSPELVLLSTRILHPRHCLLLFSREEKDMGEHIAWVLEKMRELCPEVDVPAPIEFRQEELLTGPRLPDLVWSRIGICNQVICLDLTAGNKLMTLALAFSVARQDSRLFYLRNRQVPGTEMIDPESTRPILWRADSGPNLGNGDESEAGEAF